MEQKQSIDMRAGKRMPVALSNENLRIGAGRAWSANVAGTLDPTRTRLDFEVGKGGVIKDIDQSLSIPKRVRAILNAHGIQDPNIGRSDEELKKSRVGIRTYASFVIQGSHDTMLKLAFGEQLVDFSSKADNSHLTRDVKIEQWATDVYNFMARKYGEDNIASFVVHLDETTPHAHCVVVPITDTGELSFRKVFIGEQNDKLTMSRQMKQLCAEMGAGIQMIYSSRPIVTAKAAEGLMVRTLGSGSNGIGYYMYHGGSTPKQIGGVGSFQDEPMGMPKVSYDFQAPLGEFGLEGKMYRNLRLLHSFLADFGDRLAPMETVLPEDWEKMTPDNRDDLRWAVRMKDDKGFVFMINFQDHDTLRHDMNDLQLKLNLKGEELRIPASGTFTLPKDESVILPFNLDMNGALLKYATAQLLMKLDDNGTEHYFFFAPEGMATEFLFDKATVKGKASYKPVAGFKSTFVVKTATGKTIKINTLTRQQALNALKVNGRLLIADATVLPREDGADLLCLGKNTVDYVVYPSKQGFKTQKAVVETVTPQIEVKKAGPRRMSVGFQNDNASHVQEYFLRIRYVGDVAMAFMKGQLVQDEFYHGEPWTIGLKRYYDDLKTDPLTFYFRPLRPDVPFLRDLPREVVPDFSNGPVMEVRQVEIVPEYKFNIKF